MKVLGIETATRTGGVAVVSESGVIAEYTLNIEVTHSERLMATVDRVLKGTGLALADLDGLSVSVGPGSFTGLRIGIATVKGIAFTTGKPVVAVPTLRALAWNLPHAAHPVCPLLDARKKEVYAALYRYENCALLRVMEEQAIALEALAGKISGRTIFTGEAAHCFRDEIVKLFGDRALFAPRSSMVPSAASVAEIGLLMLKNGERTDPDVLTPVYIRRPEAEVAWEKRRQSQ
jgi:tRNA threonylcarbamoyladenosine biosynthesis protein TsaB